MATGTAQNAQKKNQNNKNTGGEDKCRCFFCALTQKPTYNQDRRPYILL